MTSLSEAIESWKKILGEQYVLTDPSKIAPYHNNVSALTRKAPAVLRPNSTQQVRDIVRVANQFKTPLYPVGCGKNLGLGSQLPVRDGTSIVDLSRMNRILEVNAEQHYAVVEPGVSQGQLYDHLLNNQIPLRLNVTGCGREASVIGNVLERGIGYFSTRADSLSGMEVVLGNGEIIRTGFGHYPNCKTVHTYRYGIGPDLNGLFSQGNFGIVTSAGVDLMPKKGTHMTIIASLRREEDLSKFIDTLADLRRSGVIQAVVHVGNKHRTEITLAPLVCAELEKNGINTDLRRKTLELLASENFGPWSAIIGLFGPRRQMSALRRETWQRLRPFARIVFLNDTLLNIASQLLDLAAFIPFFSRKRTILNAVKPLYGLSKGIPTDAAMNSLYWPVGERPPDKKFDADQTPCGMLYCLPMMPLSGKVAKETMDATDRISAKHGFNHCTTLNMLDHKTLEAVISLPFDRRNSGQTQAAHRCLDETLRYYIDAGYPPYRVGIQSMSAVIDEKDSFWQTVRSLKNAMDPNHIIAPGRYNLA
ncbi:MAG: FAD-binding oxidoreductase [Verrucomicrobiae bacterium]|nr:FAD-binding oxidoreductase [Verrucomicrobiae bacterium]